MTRLVALFLGLAAAACASAPEAPVAPTRAQALAALLIETEAAAPDRIHAAGPEMAALEAALIAPVAARSPNRERAAAEPGPAPALAGAASVLSAVHLASYRDRATAARGWAQLQARHAALAGLGARLQRVDLGERGVFLRLKAGPYDTPDAAKAACAAFEAQGEWCAVTPFHGDRL